MAAEISDPGVVITGAAGDMGAALAASFIADGYTVFGADIAAPQRGTGSCPSSWT